MTTYEIARTDTALFAGAAFFRNATLRISNVLRAFKHRREATALSDLDDRMLADVGITRGDLRAAMIQPLWNDPTSVLACRAAHSALRMRY